MIYGFHFWDQAHLNTLVSLIRLTLENYYHTLTPLLSSNFLSLKPATASAASNKSAATKRNLLLDFGVQYIGLSGVKVREAPARELVRDVRVGAADV